MAFQKGNFPLIPMAPDRYDPDYSAFDNIVQDYQEGLERPRKTELERSARERAERLAAMNEALQARFGPGQAERGERLAALEEQYKEPMLQAQLGSYQAKANAPQPLSEQEKMMMRIEEDRLKKEQALQLAKEQGTPADITARHKVVRSAENVIPALKDLRDMKLPSVGFGTTVGSPKTLASYNTRIVNLVESMLGAYGLSATDKSIKAVEESIKKHSFEGDKAYRQRLDHIIKDIQERKSRAKEGNPLEGDENDRMRAFIDTALSGGGSSNIAKQSDDDLLKIVRGS